MGNASKKIFSIKIFFVLTLLESKIPNSFDVNAVFKGTYLPTYV